TSHNEFSSILADFLIPFIRFNHLKVSTKQKAADRLSRQNKTYSALQSASARSTIESIISFALCPFSSIRVDCPAHKDINSLFPCFAAVARISLVAVF